MAAMTKRCCGCAASTLAATKRQATSLVQWQPIYLKIHADTCRWQMGKVDEEIRVSETLGAFATILYS